jgi:hypothetical protein
LQRPKSGELLHTDFISRQREFLERRDRKVQEQRKIKELREEQEYQNLRARQVAKTGIAGN